MFKQIFLILIILFLCNYSFSQVGVDTASLFLNNTNIPSFNILTVDSTQFSKNDLPKDKAVVIVFFSPTCTHCRAKAKMLSERIDSLSKSIFIWASYHPLPELKEFNEHFGLTKFKNVIVGRDVNYFFPVYFKTTVTPYVAVYGSNGYFEKDFRHGSSMHEIIEVVNKE